MHLKVDFNLNQNSKNQNPLIIDDVNAVTHQVTQLAQEQAKDPLSLTESAK